jgi:oxygen-dependent protoporphyrinogen oxidase
VAGIFTADAEKLSLAAAFPQFHRMERQYGSLSRAIKKSKEARLESAAMSESGARYGLFVTPRDGLGSLVEALARRLPSQCVQLGSRVERLTIGQGGGWKLWLSERDSAINFDAVVLAVPAHVAAKLLEVAAPDLACEIRQISYTSSAIVLAGYRRDQIEHPLDGFGLVVPAAEKREILATSFSSVKFPGRAPEGHVLLRVFFGGAARSQQVEFTDDVLKRLSGRELGELIGARGEPELFRVCRWRSSMPQYHVGHLARIQRIESQVMRLSGLALAGNAYRGVGIPQCIRSGEEAANRMIEHLKLKNRSI